MSDHHFTIHIERIDAARNMARYYQMSIEPSLFGQAALLRRWGRIGTRGQQKIQLLEDHDRAIELLLAIARQKHAKGYRPKGDGTPRQPGGTL